jgi:hypothetical protein
MGHATTTRTGARNSLLELLLDGFYRLAGRGGVGWLIVVEICLFLISGSSPIRLDTMFFEFLFCLGARIRILS